VRENSDYVYTGAGRDYRMGPDEVLAYEKPQGLSDGVNVLFGDGHVEFLPMEVATATIRDGRKGGQAFPGQPGQRPRPLRPPVQRDPADRFAPRRPGGGV
jgi:prepilin-type processing-associated H-X9-DG protein